MSSPSPSLRTMISSRQARRILLRVAAVAAEWDQARARSAPSAIKCCFCCSSSGGDRSVAGRYLPLDPLHVFERDVPASLELVGDQPVRWINGIVLPAGVRCLVASLRVGQGVLS